MNAKYYLFKNPPNPDKPDEYTYHVRLTQRGTIPFLQICKEVAAMCTISLPDCVGALSALSLVATRHMKSGHSIELEGFGYLKPIAKGPIVSNPKDIRAGDIRFAGVQFRPSAELREEMKFMRFERDPAYRHAAVRKPEKRIEVILNHIAQEGYIKSSDCMRINGCTHYLALKDLKHLSEKGVVTAKGRDNNRFYVLTNQNTNK